MLPTYNVYVRVYAAPVKASGYRAGDVRFEARVAGTHNDAQLAKRPEYRRVGTFAFVSQPAALRLARQVFDAQRPAG